MAKKKMARRVPQTGALRMYGDGKPSQAALTAAGKAPASSRPSASVARGAVDFSKEYSYVLGDLRRLGLVAVGVFAALMVLKLFIR